MRLLTSETWHCGDLALRNGCHSNGGGSGVWAQRLSCVFCTQGVLGHRLNSDHISVAGDVLWKIIPWDSYISHSAHDG